MVVMSPRMYVDSAGNIIGHKDYAYEDIFNNVIVKGETLLNYCVSNNINLYGSLSDIMLNKIVCMTWSVSIFISQQRINRLNMLFEI